MVYHGKKYKHELQFLVLCIEFGGPWVRSVAKACQTQLGALSHVLLEWCSVYHHYVLPEQEQSRVVTMNFWTWSIHLCVPTPDLVSIHNRSTPPPLSLTSFQKVHLLHIPSKRSRTYRNWVHIDIHCFLNEIRNA